MQKTINIQLDTIRKQAVVSKSNIKKGDTLLLLITLLADGAALDISGQSALLILKKSDNYVIEKILTGEENRLTAELNQQATLAIGTVAGEVQLIDEIGTSISNSFSYEVDNSLADNIILKSIDDIQTLKDIQEIIANYNAEAGGLAEQSTIAQAQIPILEAANTEAALVFPYYWPKT